MMSECKDDFCYYGIKFFILFYLLIYGLIIAIPFVLNFISSIIYEGTSWILDKIEAKLTFDFAMKTILNHASDRLIKKAKKENKPDEL